MYTVQDEKYLQVWFGVFLQLQAQMITRHFTLNLYRIWGALIEVAIYKKQRI